MAVMSMHASEKAYPAFSAPSTLQQCLIVQHQASARTLLHIVGCLFDVKRWIHADHSSKLIWRSQLLCMRLINLIQLDFRQLQATGP